MKSEERVFDFETILAILSDKNNGYSEKSYNALCFLEGRELSSDEISEVTTKAKRMILVKYPFLYHIFCNIVSLSEEEITSYLERQKIIYGNSFSLSSNDLENNNYVNQEEINKMRTLKYFIK